MPRNTDRPLSADEQRFIRHYVRERDIERAERKARLKSGQGMQFYRRAHVREDIDRRVQVIENEQAKIDARDIERRDEITADFLDNELKRICVLDAEKFGSIKLKALLAGYVVRGKIRQGNTLALDTQQAAVTSGVSIYESVFERRREVTAMELHDPTPAAPVAPRLPPKPQAPAENTVPQVPAPPKKTLGRTVIRAY